MKISPLARLMAALPCTAALLLAQTAGITGRVIDSSDAVMPSVTVAITNTGTGIGRRTVTNADGYYTIASLQPGNYRLTLQSAGMKKIERDNIILAVDQTARLNFTMEVGAATESVQVSADAPLVNSENATVGTVVENRRIQDLPLNGRNVLALTLLVPGVRSQAGPTNSGFGDRGIALSAISINGGPGGQNQMLLDGNNNNGGQDYEVSVNPAVDAIQEFKVQSNTMSAEYGFTTGGVINMVTKSGTNQPHGTLYEFFRNDKLDARNAFAVQRAPFRYNQFGGAIGGPVVLPKLYNGKDRTFFFFNYEEWRYRRFNYPISSVPTLQERQGDFSDLRDSSGRLIPIYDPLTTRANPNGSGFIRDPFPGNAIPTVRLDPVAQKTLQLIPEPNRPPDNSLTNQNNFISSIGESRYSRQFTGRADQHISDKNTLFGRYSWFRHFTNGAINSNPWPNPVVNQRLDTLTQQNAVVSDTHVFSPTVLNELRVGTTRTGFPFVAASYQGDWPVKLGLPSNVPNIVLPRMSIDGLPGFSQSDVGLRGTLIWDGVDNVTINRGAHSLKLGIDYRHYQINNLQASIPSGQFNFASALTNNPLTPAGTGSGFATFLLGSVSTASLGTYLGQAMQSWSLTGYGQDDWKITPRLTLNLGLRYDYQTPPVERHNGLSNFDPYKTNPENGLLGRMEYAGKDFGGTYLGVDKLAFSPRVGFAFDVLGSQRLVVRGGYGIFRPMIAYREFFGSTAGFATTTTTYLPPGGNTALPAFQLKNGFPSPAVQPQGAVLGPSAFLSSSVTYNQASSSYPLSQQWNLSVQLQPKSGWLIDTTYSGNKGTHVVAGNYELNQIDDSYYSLGNALSDVVPNPYSGRVPGAFGGATIVRSQLLKPYPYYSSITVTNPTMGNSIYHALLMSVQKRFSAGFTLLGSYTFAKLIDDSVRATVDFGSVEQVGVVGYQDGKFARNLERSVDPTDVSNRFVLSALYELPFGAGKGIRSSHGFINQLIGGWQVNTITTLQGGLPLVVRGASNFRADRPNSTGKSAKLDNPTALIWFDTSAFVNPPNFTLGNVGRVLPDVRSPGIVNVDLSLIKDTRIRERMNLQFRAEAFNVANHVDLGFPNVSFVAGTDGKNRSATFGTITSARDARIGQLALKLSF